MILNIEHFFHISIDHLNDFLGKWSNIFSFFLKLGLDVLLLSCNFSECVTDTSTLSAIRISNIFSQTGTFHFQQNIFKREEKFKSDKIQFNFLMVHACCPIFLSKNVDS